MSTDRFAVSVYEREKRRAEAGLWSGAQRLHPRGQRATGGEELTRLSDLERGRLTETKYDAVW
jgi:hypothetical protein